MLVRISSIAFTAALLCSSSFSQGATPKVPLDDATMRGNEVIETPIGDISLEDTYFEDEGSKRLYDKMDYERANQLYIWSYMVDPACRHGDLAQHGRRRLWRQQRY